jgi:hypothetical protein
MALRYWVSNTGNWDATSTTNWAASSGGSSGAAVPTTSDDVYFDVSSGTGTVTAVISPDVNSLTSTSTCPLALTFAGHTLTCETGTLSLSNTGTLNLGNGLTLNGATALFYVDTSVGAVTSGSCVLAMNGTTDMTMTVNKALTVKSLTLGSAAVVIMGGSATLTLNSNSSIPLTLNANSTFTHSNALYLSDNTTGNVWYKDPTAVWTANGAITLGVASSGNIISIPGHSDNSPMVIGGTNSVTIAIGAYTDTFQFTGHQNYGTKAALIYKGQTTGAGIINFNNYNLTCGSLTTGYTVSPTTGSFVINYSSSAISCTSYSGAGYNNACTQNFQNSQWTVTGNGAVWSYGSTHTITNGQSCITFTNSANTAMTIAGAGKSFNNVTFARAASTAAITVTGSNTFNNITDIGSAAHSLLFTAGTTQSVNSFNVSGTSGKLITINSDTTSAHNLVFTGPTCAACDYLSVQHSIASPAGTWYAGIYSTNNQDVTVAGSGWVFTAPPNCFNYFFIS